MKRLNMNLGLSILLCLLLLPSLGGEERDRRKGEIKGIKFNFSKLSPFKRMKSADEQGRAYFQREEYGKSADAFREQLKQNSRDPKAWFYLGMAQHRNKEHKDAMISFLTSYRYKQDLNVLFYAGQSQFNAGRVGDASRTFKKVLANDPAHGPAWKLLGRCFETNHHIDRARMAYEKALILLPKDNQLKDWIINLPKEKSLDPSAIRQIITPNNKRLATGIRPGSKIVTGSTDKDAILPPSHILDVGVYGESILNIPGQLPRLEEVYHISYDAPEPTKLKPTSVHPNLKDSFKKQGQMERVAPKEEMSLPDL